MELRRREALRPKESCAKLGKLQLRKLLKLIREFFLSSYRISHLTLTRMNTQIYQRCRQAYLDQGCPEDVDDFMEWYLNRAPGWDLIEAQIRCQVGGKLSFFLETEFIA